MLSGGGGIIRGFVISGGSSSVGKTTVTLGLMNLFKNMTLSAFDLRDFDLKDFDLNSVQLQVGNLLNLEDVGSLENIESIRNVGSVEIAKAMSTGHIKDVDNTVKVIAGESHANITNESIKNNIDNISNNYSNNNCHCSSYRNSGHTCHPFKIGPDFIDPTYHKIITSIPSYNLDLFLMGSEGIKHSFFTHMGDMNIVEGVMGLYDGINNSLNNYSTAHVAKTLNLPVILVVNGKGRSLSLASEILGYKNFDKSVNIIGVILNRINSVERYSDLKAGIETHTGIKCLGYLPERSDFSLDSRHLGLIQGHEIGDLQDKIDLASEYLSKTLDVEYILKKTILRYPCDEIEKYKHLFSSYRNRYKGIKIGIAMDSAFTFYYEDNIELFKFMGMELEYFSPINDETIPDVDMLYFGGGYPENYLNELSSNKPMIQSIYKFYESNKVILGECGGFMYLSKGIYDIDGNFYALCGIADCKMKMFNKLDTSRFGYTNIEFRDKYFGCAHEFHYSQIVESGEMKREYIVSKASGKNWVCGYSSRNFLGGYAHFHFYKSMDILDEILRSVSKKIK